MTEILILGAGGQLGRELSLLYPDATKFYHSGSSQNTFDLGRGSDLDKILSEYKPDLIFNAAALANVDLCEKNRMLSYAVNGEALKVITRHARKLGSTLVHISTDYVFDGADGMYNERDVPNPLNYYGLSKLVGDIYAQSYENSLIVRTSGVFGYSKNFPIFVLERLRKKEAITAIKGFYSPIHAKNLALAITELVRTQFRGLINVAGERTSRFDLAIGIGKKFGLDTSFIVETGSLTVLNAKRPFDSSLDISLARSKISADFYSLESNMTAFEERLHSSNIERF